MYAKYIKREIPDLNGTGITSRGERSQKYYVLR